MLVYGEASNQLLHSCSVYQLTDVLDSPRRRDRCHELSSAAAVFAPESSRGHRGPLLCSNFPFATLGVRTRHVSGASVTVPVRARSGSPREVKDCNQHAGRASTVLTTLRQTVSTSSVYSIRQTFKVWPKITLCCLQVQISRRSKKFASGCWFWSMGSKLRLYTGIRWPYCFYQRNWGNLELQRSLRVLIAEFPETRESGYGKKGREDCPVCQLCFFRWVTVYLSLGWEMPQPGIIPPPNHTACAKSVVPRALWEKLLWHWPTSDYSRLSTQPQSDYIEVVDRWILKRIPISGNR